MFLARTIRHALLVAGMLALVVPAAARATPSPDRCAAYAIIPYVAPVPDAMRTVGTHTFRWHLSLVLPDGTPVDDVRESAITFDAAAPAYPRPVNLGLDANVTLLDGDVVTVTAIQPDQAARFRITFFAPKSWTSTLGSVQLRLSYETDAGTWSQVELAQGPLASACSILTFGFEHRSFGWG